MKLKEKTNTLGRRKEEKTSELVCYGNFCHCWDSPFSCVFFFLLFVSFEKSSLLFACDDENDWLTRILFLDQSANLTSYLIGNPTEFAYLYLFLMCCRMYEHCQVSLSELLIRKLSMRRFVLHSMFDFNFGLLLCVLRIQFNLEHLIKIVVDFKHTKHQN